MSQPSPRTKHRIAALLAGGMTTSAAISAVLTRENLPGASPSSVKRYLRELRGGNAPTSQAARAAPRALAAPTMDQRAALAAAVYEAGDDVEAAAALLALVRFDDPEIDGYLARGSTPFDAVLSAGHGDNMLVLRAPADIAELVQAVVGDPLIYQRDAGQSAEAFDAERKTAGEAEHARAVALLEGALSIVRSSGLGARWTS